MASRIQPFLSVAHHGAPVLSPPGSTLASLQRAVEVGAQMLSLDVRVTRDDVLVIDHEAVRLLDGQELPLRARPFPRWQAYTADTDAPLLTLSDAFTFALSHETGLMLHLREPGTETLLARAIRQSGFPMERLLVCGADAPARKTLRVLDPRIPLGLTLESEDAGRIDAQFLAKIDTDAVLWHARLLTPAIVNVLRLREIVVYAGPVDLMEEMRRVRAHCQVDGIVTTMPDLLAEVLAAL